MLKKKNHWIVLGLFMILLLAGCKCDNAAVEAFEVIADSPLGGEIVTSLTPTFNWHGSDSCDPDYYSIYIREDAGSPDHASAVVPYTDVPYTLTGDVLLPGRSYYWRANAGNEWSSSEDPNASGEISDPVYFFTGPVCSGEILVAPDLFDPSAAGWLSKEHVFKWSYSGGCLPTSYEVQFANDAGFTDIYLTATTTEPYVQHLLMAFPDCSTMFWRVRASDGTNFGPWSDSRDFHYVISDTCYQWEYPSDDFARIDVKLAYDKCDQTGEIAAWTPAPLHTGCMVEGMIIVGKGEAPLYMSDYVVDLGSGPCPSTGLDQKSDEYQDSFYYEARFGVMSPGTYCVSISKNQMSRIIFENRIVDLMDGIWTLPRTNQVIAEKTIELPGEYPMLESGIQQVQLTLFWDEVERTIITYPLDYTYECKIGPEKRCPTYGFASAGEMIPILARDRTSDWKLTEINGTMCYIQLPDALIAEHLAKYDLESANFDDLGYFVPPEPCDDSGSESGCAVHKDRESCSNAGCIWHVNNNSRLGGYCASQ